MVSVGSLETLTRIGFAARAALYIIIGYLVLRSGAAADNSDALEFVRGRAGRFLLLGMALGFAAYGLWRLSEALIDTEGHGRDAKGIALRTGGAISGLIHLGLGFYSARLATTDGGSSMGGGGTTEGASAALHLPGGQIILTIAAVAIVVAGLAQLVKAVKLGFLKQLDPAVARKQWVAWVGRAGYLARGVVFVIIGWFFWNAAQHLRAAEAGGTQEALASLPSGLRMLVAAGFVLFGIFSLVEARYRRINDPQIVARLKGMANGRPTQAR